MFAPGWPDIPRLYAEAVTTATDAVLEALRVADWENRAADKAFSDAAGDVEAMTEVIRGQGLRVAVLAVLGLTVPVPDGSWWAHLASQADPLSRQPEVTPSAPSPLIAGRTRKPDRR